MFLKIPYSKHLMGKTNNIFSAGIESLKLQFIFTSMLKLMK
jgi:hypothetical protein